MHPGGQRQREEGNSISAGCRPPAVRKKSGLPVPAIVSTRSRSRSGFWLPTQRASGPVTRPESWVLCGLVRADRFRSESQLIPYSYILTMLAAILLMAASYPFLKLYLTGPGERLRTRDVTLVAVFACVVAAVLTFILADVYFWNRSFGPRGGARHGKARARH